MKSIFKTKYFSAVLDTIVYDSIKDKTSYSYRNKIRDELVLDYDRSCYRPCARELGRIKNEKLKAENEKLKTRS